MIRRQVNLGELIRSPFSLFVLILFCNLASGQVYTGKILRRPGCLSDISQSVYKIETSYYDIYERSLNDTLMDRSYIGILSQNINLNLSRRLKLEMNHLYTNDYCKFEMDSSEKLLYNNRYSLFGLAVTSKGKFIDLSGDVNTSTNKTRYSYSLSIKAHNEHIFMQGEYRYSNINFPSGFTADTSSYFPRLFIFKRSYSLQVGYIGDQIVGQIGTKVTIPFSKDRSDYLDSFEAICEAFGLQHSFELVYRPERALSVWVTGLMKRDTSDIPVYWSGEGLGRFSVADDTVYSISAGIQYRNHHLCLGTERFSGALHLSTNLGPFVTVWESLLGGRFYFRIFGDLDLSGIFYQYNFNKKRWSFSAGISYLNISGQLHGKSYILTFPFQVSNKRALEIEIKALRFIELQPKVAFWIGKFWRAELSADMLIPVGKELKVKPEQDIPPRTGRREIIKGGRYFQANLSYIL